MKFRRENEFKDKRIVDSELREVNQQVQAKVLLIAYVKYMFCLQYQDVVCGLFDNSDLAWVSDYGSQIVQSDHLPAFPSCLLLPWQTLITLLSL